MNISHHKISVYFKDNNGVNFLTLSNDNQELLTAIVTSDYALIINDAQGKNVSIWPPGKWISVCSVN